MKLRDVIASITKLGPEELIMAVPDLHGHWQAAQSAIRVIESLPGTQAIFLGDYIDRGPSPFRTIEILIGAMSKNPGWKFLMGNHEFELLRSLELGFDTMGEQSSSFGEYHASGGIPNPHLAFLESLIGYHETTHLIFVHGGLLASAEPLEKRSLFELTWTYDISPEWDGKKIVRGHRLTPCPREWSTHIDLESGVWLEDGCLTIGVLRAHPAPGEATLLGWVEISADGMRVRIRQALESE